MSVHIDADAEHPAHDVGWYCQECGFDYDTVMPEHDSRWEPSTTYPRCPRCGTDTVDSAAWSAWGPNGEPLE